jgi:hypothetical protein
MRHPSHISHSLWTTLSRSAALSDPPRRPFRGLASGPALGGVRALVLAGGLLAAGVAGAGCATTASAGYYEPDLVYVSPGVQVIADYNEPIFYADGYYWRNAGGAWYRSSYYQGGWAYARPPGVILSINSPHRYRHYRPNGWAPRHHNRAPVAAPVGRGRPSPRMMGSPSHGAAPGFGSAPGPRRDGPPPMAGPMRAGPPAMGMGRGGPPAMAPGRAGPPAMAPGRSNQGHGHRGSPAPASRPGVPFMGRGGPNR